MDKKQAVRKQVSDFYTRSLEQGCGCGCGPVQPKGVAAKQAGYSTEELVGLPDDTVINSFGCGNPLAFSDVQTGQTVLDLGSGAGIDLLIASKKVGPSGKVIGVDMTDEMIERARINTEKAGATNVEVRKGIIEKLPVDDSSVNWVISNCVINLSPEKEKVFAEIARVLKPGGRISISDIVVQNLPDWVRESVHFYCSCVAGAISEEEYLRGLRKAGLTEVKVIERLVYEGTQLKTLIESEVPEEQSSCCGGSGLSIEAIDRAAKELYGKVWSAKFTGRKP